MEPFSDTWSLALGPPSTAKGIPCPRRCHCLQEALWFTWLRWGPFIESPHSWVSPRWPPVTCRCCIYLSTSHPRLAPAGERQALHTATRPPHPQAAALTSTTFSAAVTPRAVAPAEAGPGGAQGQVVLKAHARVGLLADELCRRVPTEAGRQGAAPAHPEVLLPASWGPGARLPLTSMTRGSEVGPRAWSRSGARSPSAPRS